MPKITNLFIQLNGFKIIFRLKWNEFKLFEYYQKLLTNGILNYIFF